MRNLIPIYFIFGLLILGASYQNCSKIKIDDGTPSQQSANSILPALTCVPGAQPITCTLADGQAARACNADGSAWGDCVATSCNSGYSIVSGVCVFTGCTLGQTSDCVVYDGSLNIIGAGKKTCKPDLTGFGNCTATACVGGYHLSGGVCVVNSCSPGAVQRSLWQASHLSIQ